MRIDGRFFRFPIPKIDNKSSSLSPVLFSVHCRCFVSCQHLNCSVMDSFDGILGNVVYETAVLCFGERTHTTSHGF